MKFFCRSMDTNLTPQHQFSLLSNAIAYPIPIVIMADSSNLGPLTPVIEKGQACLIVDNDTYARISSQLSEMLGEIPPLSTGNNGNPKRFQYSVNPEPNPNEKP